MFNNNFYPTPPEVAATMLDPIDLRGKVVVEPSAGSGNLVQACLERGATEVLMVEPEPKLRATPPAATREAGPLPQAGLTDEQLPELMPQQFRDDLATVSRLASYDTPVGPGLYRVSLNTGALAFARAVLARWGVAAVPVPVSERPWEQPGWCDAEGRCWFGSERDGCIQAVWSMRMPIQRISHQRWCAPHWALPVPAAAVREVQGNG